MAVNLILLVIGFIFTFFVPGFLIIETFFSELFFIQKLPLYLLISVLTSTYTIYIISLGIGFSRSSILFTFALSAIWLVVFLRKKRLTLLLIL